MRPRVLVVDDDAERCTVIRNQLLPACDCGLAHSLEQALGALGQGPWSAALVDYDLAHGGSGLEVLQAFRESSPRTFRILYTNYYAPSLMRDISRLADPHAVVDAREVGFLTTVRHTLDALFTPAPLDGPDRGDPLTRHTSWTDISPASREFTAQLRAAAESDSPVFLYGEPGTGQTRAAKMLRDWRQQWRSRETPHRDADAQVVTLRVPPLRERPQDLPTLAQRCLAEYARDSGEPAKELTTEVIEDLGEREWFGNVVELRAVLLRACQRAGARRRLLIEDLPHDQQPSIRPSQHAKDDGQLDCVLRQLRTARNVTGAAKLEGCTRANYIRMMRRLGILRADVTTDFESAEERRRGIKS
jgi:DNA-binding NtrC family response regulator